jgi:hypothetical protein
MKILIRICLIVAIIILSVNLGISAVFNFSQDAEGEAVRIFSFAPATYGKPPFEMILTSHPYNRVWNQYFTMGWNASSYGPPGDQFVPNEPGLIMGFENDFFNGTNRTMEWYINYVSPDRTSVPTFRPLFCSIYRDDNTSHRAEVNLDVGDAGGTFRVFANGVAEWFAYLEVNSDNTTIRNDLGVLGNIRINRSGHYTALTMGDNENGSYPGIYLKTGGFHNWLISAQYHNPGLCPRN